jgi:hypothetical protein
MTRRAVVSGVEASLANGRGDRYIGTDPEPGGRMGFRSSGVLE